MLCVPVLPVAKGVGNYMCHSTSRHSLDGSGLGSEGVWSPGASDHCTRIRHLLEVSRGSTLAPPVFWVAAAAATI
jgi:hypothetical protein